MLDASSRSPFWPAARVTFMASLLLFVITIVVGILNGLDLYTPDHDTLLTHVHAGTLGWITLAATGAALLMFARSDADDSETRRSMVMAWTMTIAIAAYVIAFFAGDRIPGDRIQRPIVGTILFIVVVWFAVWLFGANRRAEHSSVARLGLILSWIALLVGSVLGVALGIYTSQGEIPGLADETAAAVAEGHPPAMVIGFLILAAMAVIEWLFRGHTPLREDRLGAAQMWILFAAGMLANIGFLGRMEEELLGPANLLMIVGIVILIVRYRSLLLPAGWKDSGPGAFPRIGSLFLVVYVILGTVLIVQVVGGSIDFDALTSSQLGLLLAFDHSMFIGVMTNVLFGVIVLRGLHRTSITTVDKVALWGVNVGIIGFIVGLLIVSAPVKRISTPIMGISLLVGIGGYLMEMRSPAE